MVLSGTVRRWVLAGGKASRLQFASGTCATPAFAILFTATRSINYYTRTTSSLPVSIVTILSTMPDARADRTLAGAAAAGPASCLRRGPATAATWVEACLPNPRQPAVRQPAVSQSIITLHECITLNYGSPAPCNRTTQGPPMLLRRVLTLHFTQLPYAAAGEVHRLRPGTRARIFLLCTAASHACAATRPRPLHCCAGLPPCRP